MVHNSNIREEAIKKLEYFLDNPGYFAILILGDSGVGKGFNLNKVLESIKKRREEEMGEKKIIHKTFYPFQLGETTEILKNIFSNDIIIIKNIEELSINQQNILFDALSTNNGEIGIEKNIGLKRIIFTSTYNVEQLRDSKVYLSDRFWDRISQLVVKFPSFRDYSSNILEDFQSVWKNMEFKEYPKLPEDGNFQQWLINNSSSFAGNFRDLDKIAILWHQYRIISYKDNEQKFKSEIEARIFPKVRNDFEDFTHFPTQKEDASNIFEFQKGDNWNQIDRKFKSKFKRWVKENYPSIKEATKELNMPPRKMDKW